MDYKDLFQEQMDADTFNEVVSKLVQSENDKLRTDYSKKIKDLESRIPKQESEEEKSFNERLKALELKENEYKLKDTLNELGLPSELSQFLKTGTEGLEQFKDVLNQHVLNGSFQPTKHKSTETTITKEQFQKMGYSERATLAESQPEVYKVLSQQ